MEFLVLGPLELKSDDGQPVALTGPKRRALLALLVLRAGLVTPGSRLADELWQGAPPKSWATTLQTFVYQLRRRYGVGELLTTPSGYVLEPAPDAVDAICFEQMLQRARTTAPGDPGAGLEIFNEALGRWRGPAFGEFADEPWAMAEAERLEQLRVDGVEARAACAIGARRLDGVATELQTWTKRHPLRESLWVLRLVALAEDGRPSEALRVGEELRAVLRDELGTAPGSAFMRAENALIRDEPLPTWADLAGLDAPPTPVPERRVRMRSPVTRLHAAQRAQPPAIDRFVGRTGELAALRQAFAAADQGRPQVVLVTGPAGIGKSRLLNEFTPGAVAQGALLLWGTCQDDAAVPYLALATAFDGLPGQNPFDALDVVDRSAGDDSARLGLYVSVTRALLDQASTRLVVLVVEDVHAADEATLGLLRHLLAVGSENAAQQRAQLLIVTTSRPAAPGGDVDLLAGRLRRAALAHVLDLGPLEPEDARDLATDWLARRPSTVTADALVRAAGGNPLVLRSLLGRVDEAGADRGDPLALLGPTDLDDQLWHRLDELSADCHTMLVDAAVLGDGERLERLAAVTQLDAESLDALVNEAAAVEVLFADDERYWFEHPQLRQLVYHSTGAADRARRHLTIAERLDSLGADRMVVAHHLAGADRLADPSKVIEVCREASDRAAAMGAWRDALRHALVALAAASEQELDATSLAALQLRAGRAAFLARDRPLAVKHLTGAVELAEASGSLGVWGAAAVRLARESVDDRDRYASTQLALGGLERFLAAAGDEEPALRAEAHALQAEVYSDRDLESARFHAERAEQLAAEIDDDEVRAKVRFARGVRHLIGVELDAARDCFDQARGHAARLADPNPRIWSLGRLGLRAYVAGDLDEADARLSDARTRAHDSDNLGEYSMAAAVQASVAAMRGLFARCEEDAQRAQDAYALADYWFTPGILFPTLAAARATRGDLAGANASLDDWDRIHPRASRRFRTLAAAIAGAPKGSTAAADAFRVVSDSTVDLLASGRVAAQALLGGLIGAGDLAAASVEPLTDLYDRGLRFSIGWPTHVAHAVAVAHAAIDQPDEARRWFDRALTDAQDRHADGVVARVALDYGRTELHQGHERAGRELLALAEHTASKLALPLEPARHTAPSMPGANLTRVILVTDLTASTDLNARLGDRSYLPLLREHDDIIRRALEQHDGVEFKHTGDGIAAWFFSSSGPLECAATIVEEFARRNRDAGHPLLVRIALAAGEPTPIDGDLIGLSVTTAFRALEHAAPGEIVATPEVTGLARGLPWSFRSRGSSLLKGFTEPVELFAVTAA